MKRLFFLAPVVVLAPLAALMSLGAATVPKAVKAPLPELPKGAARMRAPISRYFLTLGARKGVETDFGWGVRKFGVEVYGDAESGDGLYISDVGSLAAVPPRPFEPTKGKPAVWRSGLILKARPGSVAGWDKATTFGAEAFRDDVNGNLVYITEKGRIAVAAAETVNARSAVGKPKPPLWDHGLSLKARKAGEAGMDRAKQFGVECFIDETNGALVYISETGSIAVVGKKLAGPATASKRPVFLYGLELSARKVGEARFTKETKRAGVEVYRDHVNSTLIYITENGNIAVVAGKAARAKIAAKLKAPKFSHGGEATVRKAGETRFTKDTKKVNVEAYKDENSGCRIYLNEAGEIAVVGG
jgi:hypothetical protein